jgi:hypothetical protein
MLKAVKDDCEQINKILCNIDNFHLKTELFSKFNLQYLELKLTEFTETLFSRRKLSFLSIKLCFSKFTYLILKILQIELWKLLGLQERVL